MAAADKGKFWQMHDKLFHSQQALDKDSLVKYGQEFGVDVKPAIETNKFAAQIKADQEEAAKFGARGTPAFFINGRPLSGAQPFDAFKKIIDEELANAQKAAAAGVPAGQIYAALTQNAKTGAAAPEAQKPQPAQADPNAQYKVPVGNSPVKGDKNAKVTII